MKYIIQFFILLIMSWGPMLEASTTINNAALKELPSSAQLRLFTGRQPDDGSVQTRNPPIFCWPYDPGYYALPIEADQFGTNTQAGMFFLQISTNASFAGAALQCNLGTSNNMENMIGPITNADGSSWMGLTYTRIVYCLTNGTPRFTNAVQTYTLDPSAVQWDRSMLRDTNYLFAGGVTPSMFFFPTNRDAVATFIRAFSQSGAFQSWASLSNGVADIVNNSTWWMNDAEATNMDPRTIPGIDWYTCNAALVGQMTTNLSLLTNCAYMVDLSCTLYQRLGFTNGANYDDYNLGADPKRIALIYNWCRPYMTASQRSNVVFTMKIIVYDNYFHHGWWYTDSNPSHGLQVNYTSAAKQGSNHSAAGTAGSGLFICLAMMQDSPELLEAFPFFANSLIFEGGDPLLLRSGRSYNNVIVMQSIRNIGGLSLMNIRFPEAYLTNAPWMNHVLQRLAFDNPLKFQSLTDPFSDLGVPQIQWFNYPYLDLALMTGNGAAYQQYVRSATDHPGLTPDFEFIINPFTQYYFQPPSQIDWPSNSAVDLRDGMAWLGRFPPNDWNASTNSVSLKITAPPSGSSLQHDTQLGGMYQIIAYGAQVEAGGCDGFFKNPVLGNGVFVDGIGYQNPVNDPCETDYGHITAYTNSSWGGLVSIDITKGMNRSNFSAQAATGVSTLGEAYYAAHKIPYVTKVTRDFFYSTNGLIMQRDHFETTQPAIFAIKFNIQLDTLAMNTNGVDLQWSSTNAYNGSNVNTYVKLLTDSSTIGFLHLAGSNNAVVNPFTSENYLSDFQSAIIPQPTILSSLWDHTVWVTNRVPSTNFTFITAIFPIKWGAPIPTITRKNNYTAEANNNIGSDITVTFDSSYLDTFDYKIPYDNLLGNGKIRVINNIKLKGNIYLR